MLWKMLTESSGDRLVIVLVWLEALDGKCIDLVYSAVRNVHKLDLHDHSAIYHVDTVKISVIHFVSRKKL
jgi:hypothetical protein